MIAFYVVHGHKLEDLINMGYIEQSFMYHARAEHYKEEEAKWKSILSRVGVNI
jgi:hypothetical protein